MTRTGRPPSTPPAGRLTLADAASLAKVAYSVVYQRVTNGQIPSAEQDAGSGTWTIAKRDVKLIRPGRAPKYPDGRKPFYVRVGLKRAAAWERTAGSKGVTAWLIALADAASGYSE